MAWFLNFYRCARCKRIWTDQWSCMCDDDCPHCGARHMQPYDSEELTTLIEEEGKEFVVFWSPETAEHEPYYRALGVEPQEVVLGQTEPADRRLRFYTTVGSVPVVLVQPDRQLLGAPI